MGFGEMGGHQTLSDTIFSEFIHVNISISMCYVHIRWTSALLASILYDVSKLSSN